MKKKKENRKEKRMKQTISYYLLLEFEVVPKLEEAFFFPFFSNQGTTRRHSIATKLTWFRDVRQIFLSSSMSCGSL